MKLISTTFQIVQIKQKITDCELMLLNDINCKHCTKFITQYGKQNRIKEAIVNTPAKRKAPLTKNHPNRVQLALKQERATSAELQKAIIKMKKYIDAFQMSCKKWSL